MTYTLLNAPFLVVSAFVAGLAIFLSVFPPARIIWPTLLVSVTMTAIFDNIIIGLGIVEYDPTTLSGIVVGLAPIEDFAYIVAAVLLVPGVWGISGFVSERWSRR